MTTTEAPPAFLLITNPFCVCHAQRGYPTCHRALCRECGAYLALHAPTAERAEADAELVLDVAHRCRPFGSVAALGDLYPWLGNE